MTISLEVDGRAVAVDAEDASLLEVLRDHLGIRSPKDGCSPQGQCGCCTVLVDGQPRVACVTPVRRVRGRSITTVDGLAPEVADTWASAFCATGASQCGFCTPGIVLRLEGLRRKRRTDRTGGDDAAGGAASAAGAGPDGDRGATDLAVGGTAASAGGSPGVAPVGGSASPADHPAVERALAAHLCRCTGWRTILDAWDVAVPALDAAGGPVPWPGDRDVDAARQRAALEGGVVQEVAPQVALGRAGFADDVAPADALVAVPDGAGGWAVGESLAEARLAAGKVQGRRTTVPPAPPLDLPDVGGAVVALRTSWVEPGYLETDASWCQPGGEPASPLANGGAFGGKVRSPVGEAARRLADEHGRPVRVLLAREDTVRLGPKRPPISGAVRPDGTGVLRVVATPGIEAAVASVAPGLTVEQVEVPGPHTSLDLRGAGWVEAAVLVAAAGGATAVRSPGGAEAEATIGDDGTVDIRVSCGPVLDEVVLRSYVVGAVHQALSWVTSEALAVDDHGDVLDLTIRSFGILRAIDMPAVHVRLDQGAPGDPVNGSDAVLAAVALAVWRHQGLPDAWPTGLPVRTG